MDENKGISGPQATSKTHISMSKPAFEMLCSLWRVLFWYQCGRLQLLGPNLVRSADLRPSLVNFLHAKTTKTFRPRPPISHAPHTPEGARRCSHKPSYRAATPPCRPTTLQSTLHPIYIWYVSGDRRTQTTSFRSNETFTTIKF